VLLLLLLRLLWRQLRCCRAAASLRCCFAALLLRSCAALRCAAASAAASAAALRFAAASSAALRFAAASVVRCAARSGCFGGCCAARSAAQRLLSATRSLPPLESTSAAPSRGRGSAPREH
jgi:hypothetical protein